MDISPLLSSKKIVISSKISNTKLKASLILLSENYLLKKHI